MTVLTVKLKGSTKLGAKLGFDPSCVEVVSTQWKILLEYAEGLFNLGHISFDEVRINPEFYCQADSEVVAIVRILKKKHPAIHDEYSSLPKSDKNRALFGMLCNAASRYKSSTAQDKLKVLKYSKNVEKIEMSLPAMDIPDKVDVPAPETPAIEMVSSIESSTIAQNDESEDILDIKEGTDQFNRLFGDLEDLDDDDDIELLNSDQQIRNF